MRKWAVIGLLLVPLLSFSELSFGYGTSDGVELTARSRLSSSYQPLKLQVGVYYRALHTIRLNGAYVLLPGTDIVPLEIDSTAGTVKLGIEVESDSDLPSQLTVALSDLKSTNFIEIARSEYSDGDDQSGDSLDELVRTEIDEMIVYSDVAGPIVGRRLRVTSGGSPGCYRDVKLWLVANRLVSTYPAGSAAWTGFETLKNEHAFKPVEFSESLPTGAVCVSEGGKWPCREGRKKCGHIAVKIGEQKWYGAGIFPTPLLRNHYDLRCLVKQ